MTVAAVLTTGEAPASLLVGAGVGFHPGSMSIVLVCSEVSFA